VTADAGELDLVRRTVHEVMAAGGVAVRLPGLASLGLVGLLVPEDRGGAGWCPVEAAVVADEVGRAAALGGAPEPGRSGTAAAWLTATIAAAVLARSGPVEVADDQLDRTLDGTDPTVAAAGAGRLRVAAGRAHGTLTGVEAADQAPAVVVLGNEGQAVLVDLRAGGATVGHDATSIDTTRALQRVDLDGAPARLLAPAPDVYDAALVLTAASSLGHLRAALERLIGYLSERVAFRAPVASFQAVQHRLVDLALIEVRAGVAVVAAAQALAASPQSASRAAAVAHAYVTEHVPPALDECIQLTGGIGFTWEYPLHHELRRAVGDAAAFGSARSSRERFLTLAGWA